MSKPKCGPHKWSNLDGRTGECVYQCGCYMGHSSNSGPLGIDPFGECPNNPDTLKEQVRTLTLRAETAEAELASVKITLQTFRSAAMGMRHQLAQSRGE